MTDGAMRWEGGGRRIHMQEVGTRDGLRIIVQAYVAWQVQGDADGAEQQHQLERGDV